MKLIGTLLLFFVVGPVAISAQNVEVAGAVESPSGTAIVKASVEFRNQDTGIRWQTITNRGGLYSIGDIDPGNYDATVQAKGFKTLTRENIAIQSGHKAQIDFKMEVEVAAYGAAVRQASAGLDFTGITENVAFSSEFIAGCFRQTVQPAGQTSGTEPNRTADETHMDKEGKPVRTRSPNSKL